MIEHDESTEHATGAADRRDSRRDVVVVVCAFAAVLIVGALLNLGLLLS